MKNKQSPLFFIAGLAIGVPAAHAADLTWDNSATAGIQVPASGTWTNGGAGWSTNGTTLVNWAAANVAIFGGADGTYGVTVGGSFSAQKIRFANSGYTLAAASAQTITLTSTAGTGTAPQLNVITGKTATIGSNVTVAASNTFYIGADNGTAGGTLNIDGGTVRTAANGASLVIDGNGTIVNVKTGGTLSLLSTSTGATSIVVGQLANSNASLNVDGGSVLVNHSASNTGALIVGNQGLGTVTLTNGNITVNATSSNGVVFGNSGTTAGNNVLNLDGGTLTTSIVKKGGNAVATATFNFNGGTLKANKDSATFMEGLTTANVKAGGAKIDSNGFNIAIGQALVADSPSGGLTKEGGLGTLILSGTNTYTGATTISAGVLQIGNGGTTGRLSATTSITNDANLTINRSDAFSQAADLGAGVAITGTGSFTQAGAGTTTLTATNTYSGPTAVTAGTLVVNGNITTSDVTVSGTGTLKGNASIGGSVTINSGGTLATGNSIESLATGALSFGTGSNFEYELDKDAAANVAGDLTAVTGNLSLAGTVNLSFIETGIGSWELGTPLGDPFGSPAADKLTLISYTGTWNGGLFTYLGNTVLDDSAIVINGQQWWFNYNDTDAGTNFTGDLGSATRFVTMTVPEPGAALLGGLGFLALLRRRR